MEVCHNMNKCDCYLSLPKMKNEYKTLNINGKFSPHKVCLDDQHPSLCSQTMYFSISNNIASDYCLCMSYHDIHTYVYV